MERNLSYGAVGCFAATLFSIFLIKYNPNPFLLVLLPMWGLVFGVALARVITMEKETVTLEKPTRKLRKSKKR